MKYLTKSLAALAAVLLLLTLLPFSAMAAERETEVAVPVPSLSAADNSDYAALGLTDEQLIQLQKDLTDAGKAWEDALDVRQYNIANTAANVLLIRDLFAQDCPELFHTWFSYYTETSSTGSVITQIVFNYDTVGYAYEDYLAIRQEYEAVAAAMTADLDGLTDVQKALLLHDRLAIHCAYDKARLDDGELTNPFDDSFSMVGALVNGAAVCQGYAEAYSYLLNLVGIESYLCASEALNHVWNIVIIDGVKYHVDVTWDDPVWDKTGQVNHNNFLLSSSGIYASGHNATDYDTSPTDTRYDEGDVWKCSKSEFQYLSGDFYYIDHADETLERWNGVDLPETVISVDDAWPAGGNLVWTGNFSKLSSWMDTLYYSLTDSIYAYNILTDTSSVAWEPDLSGGNDLSIYGFTVQDNRFICDVTNSPNYVRGTKEASLQSYVFREAKVNILGSSLTLGDTLDINLSIEIPSTYKIDEVKLAVTVDGSTRYVMLPDKGIDTVYTVVLSTSAKDMTAEYTLQIVDSEYHPLGSERVTSIRKYAEILLVGNYESKIKTAAQALLNYGAAAQIYFGIRTGNLANSGYQLDLTAADVSHIDDTVKENSLASYLGCSLVLRSEVHIRIYFSEAVTGSTQNGGRYYLSIENIGGNDLATLYTVEVDGATYRVSALSLAKTVIEGDYADDFQNLMRALVLYADAVQAL